jgi:hypothetical protein
MDSSRLRGDLRLDNYLRCAHTFCRNDTGAGNCARRASDLLAPFPRCERESPEFTWVEIPIEGTVSSTPTAPQQIAQDYR